MILNFVLIYLLIGLVGFSYFFGLCETDRWSLKHLIAEVSYDWGSFLIFLLLSVTWFILVFALVWEKAKKRKKTAG